MCIRDRRWLLRWKVYPCSNRHQLQARAKSVQQVKLSNLAVPELAARPRTRVMAGYCRDTLTETHQR
eukprot:4314724-Amphidinium_carterae.1